MDEQFDTTHTDEAFDALRGYVLRTPLAPVSAIEARGRKRQKQRRTAAVVASAALVATAAIAIPTVLDDEPSVPREVASAPAPDPALTPFPSEPGGSPPSDDTTPGVGGDSFDPALLLNAEELPEVGRDWVMHQEQRGWDQMTRLNPCQRDTAPLESNSAVDVVHRVFQVEGLEYPGYATGESVTLTGAAYPGTDRAKAAFEALVSDYEECCTRDVEPGHTARTSINFDGPDHLVLGMGGVDAGGNEYAAWYVHVMLRGNHLLVASYADGEAVRVDPTVAVQLAAAQRLKHRDGQLLTRRENDQSCGRLAPSRLPNGSEPGQPRFAEDLVVWGTGTNQVAQKVGNPLDLTEDWASRTEFRGGEALFATVGDPGQIAFFFMVGRCEYTTWLGPGVSVRDARTYFRTF